MATFNSPHRHLVINQEPKIPRIEFINGEFKTEDQRQIEALRKHPGYGRYIFEPEALRAEVAANLPGPFSPTATDPEGDGVHVCPECGREFDTPQGLATHFRQKHPDATL